MMPEGTRRRSDEAEDFEVTFGEDGKREIC